MFRKLYIFFVLRLYNFLHGAPTYQSRVVY